MKNPKYLYHYTSIDTLALILKNRTIRFNKLTNTDDPDESKANDYDKPGRYMFVSCWMDGDEESIPMWNMYSKRSSGIRIKLPFFPFENYNLDNIHVLSLFATNNQYNIPIKHIINDKYIVSPPILCNYIEYTNDKEKLLPTIQKITKETYTFILGDVGIYKRKAWEFQKEYRYRIMVFPAGLKQFDELDANYVNSIANTIQNNILKNVDLPIDYIDLEIHNEAFEKMEITLGPNTTHSDEIIVNLLVKEYNPHAKVEDSELKNKVLFR
ncbi:hypothetical protein CACET_c31680 [Clostridium aceticum]|uniref:DUF2971 domain-containing protein n=1 Tax=Clostridium aceticum TaxID=84022 RepID=A0A0G3WFB0_9CLOT|nr:DUF2971 domain-containing protein [Clostridium aceticum]AKL96612.1 hypothetical protein CACET_c31680 [Clostridium aceticum]